MTFNVLTDPWIPVRLQDGSIEEMGILDTLRRAPECLEISDAMANYEFGMYRLLFTFLMDAYHPEVPEDIIDLYEQGEFDQEVIDSYVELCRSEGVSFDLFDQKRPFMQEARGNWKDSEIKEKSVAELNPSFPTGNNPIHFVHQLEENVEFTFAETIKGLCAISLFSTHMTQDYPSSVNGAPPVFSLVHGRNLFQTLVLGMVPGSALIIENYDRPGPIWRQTERVIPKKEVPKTSLLEGLTFPARKVSLLKWDESKVTKILFAQGENFIGYDSWKDPYVTYVIDEKGVSSLKPSLDKDFWMDIGSIYNTFSSAPFVVKQYCDLFDPAVVELNIYSVVTKQAVYLGMKKGYLSLPGTIIRKPIRINLIQTTLKNVEDMASKLNKKIASLATEIHLGKKIQTGAIIAEAKKAEKTFYFRCQNKFYHFLLPELQKDEVSIDAINKSWSEQILKIYWQIYDEALFHLNLKGEGMLMAQKVKYQSFQKEVKAKK